MQTRVTVQSQSHRLRQRLQEAEVGHGQEIRADLSGIRITAVGGALAGVQRWLRPDSERHSQAEVYFCTLGRIRVREVLDKGDGRPLPETVVLEGLEVPESGNYDILSALIQSNGNIRVVVDQQSRVVRTEATAGMF